MRILHDEKGNQVTIQAGDVIRYERHTFCILIERPTTPAVTGFGFRWASSIAYGDTKRLMYPMTDEQFRQIVNLIADILGFNPCLVDNEHLHHVVGPSYVFTE